MPVPLRPIGRICARYPSVNLSRVTLAHLAYCYRTFIPGTFSPAHFDFRFYIRIMTN